MAATEIALLEIKFKKGNQKVIIIKDKTVELLGETGISVNLYINFLPYLYIFHKEYKAKMLSCSYLFHHCSQ